MGSLPSDQVTIPETLDSLVTIARQAASSEIVQMLAGVQTPTEQATQVIVTALRESDMDLPQARSTFVSELRRSAATLPVTDLPIAGRTVIQQAVDPSLRDRFARQMDASSKASKNAFMADYASITPRVNVKNVFAKADVLFHPADAMTIGFSGNAGSLNPFNITTPSSQNVMATIVNKVRPETRLAPITPKINDLEAAVDAAQSKGLRGQQVVDDVVERIPLAEDVISPAPKGRGGRVSATGKFGTFASRGARKVFSLLPVAGALVDASLAVEDYRQGDYAAFGGHIGDALIGIIPPADIANLVVDLSTEESGGVVSLAVSGVESLNVGSKIADSVDKDRDGKIDIF